MSIQAGTAAKKRRKYQFQRHPVSSLKLKETSAKFIGAHYPLKGVVVAK